MERKWYRYIIHDIWGSEMITVNNQRENMYGNTPKPLLFKPVSSIRIKIHISPRFVIRKNGFEDRKIDGHHYQSWVGSGDGSWEGGGENGGVGGWGIGAGATKTPSIDIWVCWMFWRRTTPRLENWVVMTFWMESLNFSFS